MSQTKNGLEFNTVPNSSRDDSPRGLGKYSPRGEKRKAIGSIRLSLWRALTELGRRKKKSRVVVLEELIRDAAHSAGIRIEGDSHVGAPIATEDKSASRLRGQMGKGSA